MISELTKEMLEELYIKKGKSTHEIARIHRCSSETIANRCREYGIKLKGQGKRRKKIDKAVLVRLYVSEGKTITEITKILGCSYSKVRSCCLEYGIQLRAQHKKQGNYLKNKACDQVKEKELSLFYSI